MLPLGYAVTHTGANITPSMLASVDHGLCGFRCRALIRAFSTGVDVFKMLWSSFKSPEFPDGSAVSDEERRIAKKLCYGILYRQVRSSAVPFES